MSAVEISADVSVGEGQPLLVIAGPCVVEDSDFTLRMAEALRDACARRSLGFVFKASFDKANRSSNQSVRGPGLDDGLAILGRAKDELGVAITTDIHESWQAQPVSEVADVLQIPAFLARQTDLLAAAARTGRTVNVKKAQFMSPPEMGNVVRKLEGSGTRRIMLTERGTTFGYNALVVDFRGLPQMRALGYPVCFDATHSVQSPGGLGTSSGGDRQYVPYLARAAAAIGIDALFIEVHEDPDSAPSDGPNMIPLDAFDDLLRQVVAVREALAAAPDVR